MILASLALQVSKFQTDLERQIVNFKPPNVCALSKIDGPRCRCYTNATVQDILIKLGIKPLMHLWEISIFSLNNIKPTKIINTADKKWARF